MSPDVSLGLTYETKSNFRKRKRKEDLRLPLLLVAMTKEHYSMGHVPFRKNDFLQKQPWLGEDTR